ncbi:hypothetical protein L6164_037009 [Bauhinia variegata]|uniref:Uncharacterized protein n=1 Tax=Bauhinia variegata TaxID=167791 RepID=A0ACB9KIR7_BAUVA|nr:hypothetical protein L6164_037009 [Bauhinia variegata]
MSNRGIIKRSLYVAAVTGDSEAAERIVSENPGIVRMGLTAGDDTALHIATSTNNAAFVLNIMSCMTLEDLQIRNKEGNTALCIASVAGNLGIARAMIESNSTLPMITGRDGMTPFQLAALRGRKEMMQYLYQVTDLHQLTLSDRTELFFAIINNSMYDMASKMLKDWRALATARDKRGITALHVLARKQIYNVNGISWRMICLREERNELVSATHLFSALWNEVQQLPDSRMLDLIMEPTGVLFEAAKSGNISFLVLILQSNPDLLLKVYQNGQNLLHVAVSYRQEKIISLIHNIGPVKDLIVNSVDDNWDNILHYAGRMAPVERLGTSRPNLQMQRELLWFKELQKIVPTTCLNMKNSEGLTPRELFIKEHRELSKQGEAAAKETANYCMIVATLVATVVFAAGLTVPGKDNDKSETAVFGRDVWFVIFVVSNAVSLFASSTSIILFLSILTSSFREREFLKSLQTRLIFGLTSLFISITSMVIAFASASFLIFDFKSKWVPDLIASLACIPVILFLVLHFSLWADLFGSYYWSKNLFHPSKYKIY